MLRLNQLKLSIPHTEQAMVDKICSSLHIQEGDILNFEIMKRSIDARKRPDLFYVYTVDLLLKNEKQVLKRNHNKNLTEIVPKSYQMPKGGSLPLDNRPYIIGAGPAGLFCAYMLTELGFCPIVVERGKCVEERKKDVLKFWETGVLDTESNVQFGEGGAGAFSDGKLNTAVKDPSGRIRFVLEKFVQFGAKEQIIYDAKPHIGTDILENVLVNMRQSLEEKGCSFLFEHLVEDFIFDNQRLTGLKINGKIYPTSIAVLAPGHSSRDTFQVLFDKKVSMEQKQFAVGFRVEHPQEMIDQSQYGEQTEIKLPAAPYKVTSNFPNGRGVYSFCMCPGGYVVNSSSTKEGCVVNGMSYSGRNSKNANSAIIVTVKPEDFDGNDALAGVRFQQNLEHKCFLLGNGKIPQQLYGDFCHNKASSSYGAYESQVKGQTCFANLRGLLSSEMEDSFMKGMNHFAKIIPKFDRPDAIMSGVESRTSSPLRILRNEEFESSISGLYPCGEGAGYAGGIMSAAIDGIKVAEQIISKYKKNY